MKRTTWLTTVILLLAFLIALPVAAQESTPSDDEVNAIAKQLYCPVCENTPLDVCPTQACKEWREEIRSLLAEGKSEAEIKQHFVDYYGARVLAEPPRSGLNWLVYVAPPILIVAGVFILFRALRNWSRPTDQSAGAEEGEALPPPDDDYIARLEADLKNKG